MAKEQKEKTFTTVNAREPLVGFMHFEPGSTVIGKVEKKILRTDGKANFYIFRLEEDCAELSSENGLVAGVKGQLIGIRETAALRSLEDFCGKGKLIRLRYIEEETKPNGRVFHNIEIAVAS